MRRRAIRLARPLVATCIEPAGAFPMCPDAVLYQGCSGRRGPPRRTRPIGATSLRQLAPHGVVGDNYATLLGICLGVLYCQAGA